MDETRSLVMPANKPNSEKSANGETYYGLKKGFDSRLNKDF